MSDEYDDLVRSLNAERFRKPTPPGEMGSLDALARLVELLDLADRTPAMHAPDPLIRKELIERGIPCD